MRSILAMIPAIIGAGLMFTAPAHAINYDCSKAGNANKAVCKGAAAKPAAAPAVATKATARNYDCSKAGNANKAACKGSAMTPVAAAVPAAASRPAVTRAAAPKAAVANGPNGATAKCKDATYSHSATHSGACSRHGGVQTWY